ncbi:MAG: WG repeat-containing protein [Saprospiraceae bacterium]
MKYSLSPLFIVLLLLFSNQVISQVVFPVKQGQKWGLIDDKGQVFLAPTYDAVGKIDAFGYSIVQESANIGLINKHGQVIFQPQFQDLKVIDNSLFAVKQKDNWTIIDESQKVIVKEKYTKIELIEDGSFIQFLWQDKYGLISREGQLVSSAKYESIIPSTANTFYIKKNGKIGIMTKNGEVIMPPKYEHLQYGIQNFIFVYEGDLMGIFTEDGVEVQPTIWREYSKLNDNFIRLKNEKSMALFSLNTRQIVSQDKYDNYLPYANNDAIVVRKGIRVGLIDLQGNELLTTRYTEIQPFVNGLYRVKNNNGWGIVDGNDDVILPLEYDFIAPLKGSVCGVKKGQFYGIVNLKGKIVIPFEYNRISIEENQAKAYQGTALTMYNFDDEGKLRNEHNYKKVGRIKVGANVQRRRRNGTQQNFQIGNFEWYHDPMKDLWGLRNIQTGNDQIAPSYDMISIKRDLGITLVGLEGVGRYQIDRTDFRFDHTYAIVNNERGLQVSEINMWDIRFDDFEEKNLPTARVIFNDGRHGLMARNGKIIQKGFLYIGEFENGVARISQKGNWSMSFEKSNNTVDNVANYFDEMHSPNGLLSVTLYDQRLMNEGFLYSKNALWGFMDTLGKITIQPQFQYARDFNNNVAVVQLNNDWGLIGLDGKPILDCKYNDVQYLENADNQMVRVLVKKERIGLIDTLGNVVVPAIYTKVGKVYDGRIAVKRGSKWGFCDMQGNEVIPCKYDKVQDFSEGLAAFKKDRRWGFLDKNGGIIIKNTYKKVGNFKENLAAVVVKYDYQYIDKTGKIVIENTFDNAYDFENGVARVQIERYWGLIDLNGNFIHKPSKYLKIFPFDKNNVALVQTGNNSRYYAIINKNGEKLTSKKYDKIRAFNNGLAAVKGSNGYGFINLQGEEIIDAKFNNVGDFSEGIAAVQKDGKWGYMNTSGVFILEPGFSKALPFADGFGVVYEGYKNSGLVNTAGKFTIQPEVNRILAFSEGKGLMRTPEYKYSFITENNKLSKGYFQDALPFQNNIAIIKKNGRWGLLTHQGVEIVPPKYDEIEAFENGFAQIKIKSFHGVIDLEGNVIVEPDYEYITYWGNGIFRVENGDKMGYFNVTGEWIWAMD